MESREAERVDSVEPEPELPAHWARDRASITDMPPEIAEKLSSPKALGLLGEKNDPRDRERERAAGIVRPKKQRVTVRRDRLTEPGYVTMFRQRMKREGRSDEFLFRVRALIKKHGMLFNAAAAVIMPEMGYNGPDAETRLYREHQRIIGHYSAENALAEDAEEERLKTADEEFEEALSTLPPNAPKAKELEWIEAHPAMMRQARMLAGSAGSGKADSVVLLTARDILNAPHGVCPSRSAAIQLQHWANHSQKFFEQMMSEAKKKSTGDGAGADGAGVVEDDLGDLDASLAEHGL